VRRAPSLQRRARLSTAKRDSFLALARRICHAFGNANNAKAIMTNPRAQAQASKVALSRRMRERLRRFFGPWGMFVKGFIKHPVMVGSIVPSSPTLIRHMLRPVDWKRTKLFVEYGPGVGTFCRPILEHLPGDATLIAIDTNEDFIDYLRKDIRDSRFIAVNGSAADVEAIIAAHGFDHADYVVSGLPFSTLPAGVGPAIAAATHRVLRPGGAFLVYQFRARARDYLARHFERIDNAFEWVNVPPCYLFWGWKD
jgi:phospholipid N-methyltransferase